MKSIYIDNINDGVYAQIAAALRQRAFMLESTSTGSTKEVKERALFLSEGLKELAFQIKLEE